MRAVKGNFKKYWKYSDTSRLLNPNGLITSQTGGGGWTIYNQPNYGEIWLMLNATANTTYPRWQTSSPNIYGYVKTPKKCIITSYSTTQWCDGDNTSRICNHWIIKGYETEEDLLALTRGTVIDDNTWTSISKGTSKTVDLSSNTKGFQYYSIQMISNFAGGSYCSMGSTKFYAKEPVQGTIDDFDFFTTEKIAVPTQVIRSYWKYVTKTDGVIELPDGISGNSSTKDGWTFTSSGVSLTGAIEGTSYNRFSSYSPVIDITRELPFSVETVNIRDGGASGSSSCMSYYEVYTVDDENSETFIVKGTGYSEGSWTNITVNCNNVTTKHIRLKLQGNIGTYASALTLLGMTGTYTYIVSEPATESDYDYYTDQKIIKAFGDK